MSRDVAVAHGMLTGDGGAQRVAVELAREFDAPVYCLLVDQGEVPRDVDARQITDSRFGRWLLGGGRMSGAVPDKAYWLLKHLYQMQRVSWVEDLYDYDVVIQSKPEMGWFRQRDEQTVVRYCHHAYRRHYSQFYRFGRTAKNRMWSTFFTTVSRQTVDYPELLVANSELTAQRYRDNFAVRDERLEVCHPPVRMSHLGPDVAGDGDYYLILGRLAGNKNVAPAVEQLAEAGRSVVVAGNGPMMPEVREAAEGGDVEVLGYVDEGRKAELLSGARALVFNAHEEDFGMVPIEAMASGTPVVGVDEPYTNRQVEDGENGVLFERGDIASAVERLEDGGVAMGPGELREHARRYSTERFRSRMRELVAAAADSAAPADRALAAEAADD